MPYIRKIEMKGFKSFGPRTVTLTLDKGFTAITGPNGSGKTNIIDAVLFALGELSARRLRANSFTGLIFHGSPEGGLEKARSSKVVIQFDNSDGRIPVETQTVTISREVHKNGQSSYRLNGRKVPRGRVLDVLSMAGISPSGHNVIVQGTITRMAETSPSERRKIIEDMIGIAQYDAQKAEAEEKLRAAEISIRTAMGRIDEVQRRVDDLERERNELLRYNSLQKEIKRFEAMKLSYEIQQMEKKVSELRSKTEEMERRVEKLRQIRDELRAQRYDVEKEWRKLSSEMVEEGSTRVMEVQIKIGELRSKITELNTKIGASNASLEGLKKVRENHLQQLENMRKEIVEIRRSLQRLRERHKRLSREITLKQEQHDSLANETTQLWENLGENNKKIRELESKLDKLYQEIVDIRSEQAKKQTTIQALVRRFEELTKRKETFKTTLEELQKSLKDLEQVRDEQRNQLKSLQRTLERRLAQKEAVEREIVEAGKIAESAREAVVEFATQRELAETVAAEEKALRNIEELAQLGVIQGVYGRLKNLIKIERGYERAIEAAASGWLDALVVKDFDSAFTCTETLRRLKLGRIKIIPLEGLSNIRPLKLPKLKEAAGLASAFVKCSRRHEPAITFVFGDTVVVPNDKIAFEVSRRGIRAVTTNGDLYEPGGGFESGYYRAPIDFSAIIPSETALKSLDEAVRALREHLARREKDITAFEEEIDRTRVEIARLSEVLETLEDEINRVKRSAKRTQQNMKQIDKLVQKIQKRIQKEKARAALLKARKHSIRKGMQKIQREITELRRKTDTSVIQEMEIQREKLAEDIIKLRQNLGSIETELSTLKSKYENVLKVGYKNAKVQLNKVEEQLATVEKEVSEALEQRETLKKELLELERTRDELSRTVLTARKEASKFTSQIDKIDKKLRKVDAECERAESLFNKLQLNFQTSMLQLQQHQDKLREIGYEKPFQVTPEQLQEAEASLKMMRLELERLGAINQLALSQYAEQISRYKELSIRMNELEKEKQAILEFMDEIERKKRKVFMDAFEKINEKLDRYFEKLTGGGRAFLKLENTEDPFAGGIDMLVQFPGKPPIPVNGASGGERSVAAVAFIFALQDFTPAAFYIFDEIDAHLDAYHVERLGDLLLEESERAQFIVVTLKPEMVNKAQKVYGVYNRRGISSVISAKFKGAD